MISGEVGSSRSFDGRLDPVVLRLVGRVHMERPASEFLATGYAMPVADRDGVARTGSHEDTPRTKVLEYGHPQPYFSGGSAHVAPLAGRLRAHSSSGIDTPHAPLPLPLPLPVVVGWAAPSSSELGHRHPPCAIATATGCCC